MRSQSITLLTLVASLAVATGETVKDRKGAVLGDRAALENDPRWIYNDFEKGFAEGRRTGKPVLVVLRCVPCLACAGIDAKVLLDNTDLTPLLDRFVCVRVINANALDLARFQFDFDLSFSTLIFNGDGTLYGRYGSWTHQENPREETTDGFRRALEAALELHENYPGNRALLAGKQGKPTEFETPVNMPALSARYNRSLDWDGEVLKSCVHCHQIGDALRAVHRDRNEPVPPNLVFPFPPPEAIGLRLAGDQIAHVTGVTAGTPAAGAGLRTDDELVRLNGQPLISHADVSWVLHHAPESGTLSAVVNRNGREVPVEIELPAGWRTKANISRRVGTWAMRAMALGGLRLEDLPDDARAEHGLDANALALSVNHVGQYNEHATAKKSGFREGDILVSFDGVTSRHTEGQMIGHLLANRKPGQTVKVTVLRNGDRVELSLPMQ